MLRGLLVVMGLGMAPLSADELLSRYYAGLRERGLYRLAESDCLRRLADARATPDARAELSIELSRAYAAHATHRSGQEQAELWKRAAQVVDALRESGEAAPYRELLLAQRAFVDAARGAPLRWQVELFPLDERARTEAAAVLREARDRLKPLPDALDGRMREALDRSPGDRSDRMGPPPFVIREIRRRAEFRLAVVTVDLAKVLPTGPDRAAALHEADAALREIRKTPKPDEAAWLAEVLLIEVSRLRGDLDHVGPRVAALMKKDPPAAICDAAVAQWVRSDLDAHRPDSALERLQTHRRDHGENSEELNCLLVESLLAARLIAFEKQQPELADDLLTQAESSAETLTGAWGTRSRVLIETAREADTYGPQLAERIRQAKWAWRNGNLDEAIAAYHGAVSEAHRSGRPDLAVELAVTLATLQIEARRFTGAVTTLTGLLEAYPDTPRAADAHLLRAYAIGKQFEQHLDEEHRQRYRRAVEEHRTKFAGSPTAADATWRLARLEEHQHNWSEAVALLESIPADSKRGPDANARLAIVYERALADLEQRGEPTQLWEQRAIGALTMAVNTFPPPPEPLTASQAEIAWRLARLLVGQQQPDFAVADSLLERVIQSDQTSPEQEAEPTSAASRQTDARQADRARMAAASQLRVLCLAAQGRLEEARAIVQHLETTGPDRQLDVLSGLSTAAEQVTLQHKRAVGELQLELSQSLDGRRETLTAKQQEKLDQSLAQAYEALGQYPKAAAVYEKLIWQHPRDARLIESLARLYETCGSASCLRNASKQWQALERLQRKGSPAWLESRFHMAWCSHQQGDDEAARKLIGVTRVLSPELGSPALKAKFDQLAAELSPR